MLAHILMIGRHTLSGRFSLMLRVYRDAWRKAPEFWAERKQLQVNLKTHSHALNDRITKRFYRTGYLRQVLQGHAVFKHFFFGSKV
ncbi:hypothetical protein [Acidovorax sp. 1608163]|uniref:hypothetical protein n=1 Tax=Acidovorax sp. 1608163 TaxID=2478662 RepID=UPI001F09B1F2|nr:hypothetical protein [Acidovorax sp. 1608163]